MAVKTRAVLFDWDGTLVDTSEASFRCYVRMFESFGIPFDRDAYARTYSPNWYHTFRCLGLPEEHWPDADTRWLEHFAAERVEMIEGAKETVTLLGAREIAVGIVTSGSRPRIEREIELHGLTPHVRECICGSDVPEKKPHPAALLLCLQRLGIAPEESVYVGDSPEDVEMARAAGAFSVAIPGPYPNREALLAAKPDLLIERLSDLLTVYR